MVCVSGLGGGVFLSVGTLYGDVSNSNFAVQRSFMSNNSAGGQMLRMCARCVVLLATCVQPIVVYLPFPW
jgi:hypothetical protein